MECGSCVLAERAFQWAAIVLISPVKYRIREILPRRLEESLVLSYEESFDDLESVVFFRSTAFS